MSDRLTNLVHTCGRWTESCKSALCVIAVIGVGWYFFEGAADHGFTNDDEDYLSNARQARDDLLLLVRANSDEPWLSRIGLNLYFFVAQNLFGQEARFYHVASVCLHLLNAVLLMYFVFLTHRRGLSTAFAAGMLFMVHCMHYRAVYWISAVSLLWGVACVLGALILLQHYFDTQRRSLLYSSVCTFLLGALCHQAMAIAALFPALLAHRHGRRRQQQLLLLVVFLAPACAVLLLERWVHDGAFTGQTTYDPVGWHVFTNLFQYCFGLIFGSHLDLRYLSFSGVAMIWTGVGTATALFILTRFEAPRFWAAWTLLATLPFDMWMRQELFSRYYYFPAIGSSAILAIGITSFTARVRRCSERLASCVYWLVLLGAVASSSLTIERHQSLQYYDAGKYELFKKDNPSLAIEPLQRAIRLDPQVPSKVFLWLAWAHSRLGEFDQAEAVVLRLLDRQPSDPEALKLLRNLRRKRSAAP